MVAQIETNVGPAPQLDCAVRQIRAAMTVVAEHLDMRTAGCLTGMVKPLDAGIQAMQHLNDALKAVEQFDS